MTLRRNRGPLSLGALLDPATRELRRKHGHLPTALIASWEQIAGRELARRCRPMRFVQSRDGGVLHLVVDGTAALELQYLSAQLIERVNACLGSGAVARLKLRPGRINPPPRTLAAQNAQPAAPDPIPADADPLSFALESLRRRLKAKSQAL